MATKEFEQYLMQVGKSGQAQQGLNAIQGAGNIATGIKGFYDTKKVNRLKIYDNYVDRGYAPKIIDNGVERDINSKEFNELMNGNEVNGLTWSLMPKQEKPEKTLKEIEAESQARAQGAANVMVPGYTWDPIKGVWSKSNESMSQKAIVRQTQVEPGERAMATAGIIPAAEAGRMTLAQQSVPNVEDVKKLLFPDGTPKSFNRNLMLKSKLPVIGAMPNDRQAQTIYRKLADALGGKILIQTGVAARPEEVKAEYKKFYGNYFSDPQAAWEALTQLQDFYASYMATVTGKKLPENPRPYTTNQTENMGGLTPEEERELAELEKKMR